MRCAFVKYASLSLREFNLVNCDFVNLTRQAVTSEFHPSTIVPTYKGREVGEKNAGITDNTGPGGTLFNGVKIEDKVYKWT